MLTISQSSDFAAWLKDLADQKARHRAGKTDGKRIEGSQQVTKTTFSTFDAADYLNNDEVIAEYLSAAMEDENPDVLLMALLDVAKASGMAQTARSAGLGRESLYKTLSAGSKPRFETIAAVLRALNVKISVKPKDTIRTVSTRKTSKPRRAGQAA